MRSKLVSVVIIILVVSLAGCEAFVRKFTRKSKKEKVEELILAPEEYKAPSRTPEEVYRGYLLFWKSWHDELINSLSQGSSSRKKRIDCAQEALKNLTSMRDMLDDASWRKLNKYVVQLADLRDSLKQDLYGTSYSDYYHTAERIRSSVIKDFSFGKIRKYIK